MGEIPQLSAFPDQQVLAIVRPIPETLPESTTRLGHLLLRPGSIGALLVKAVIQVMVGGVRDPFGIGTPDGKFIQPRAEGETCDCIICQVVNPYVHVTSVAVGLLKSHVSSIWREAWIGKKTRVSDSAELFPAPVKPNQLGFSRTLAGLDDQSLVAGHAEKSQIGLGKVLDPVADGAGFSAERIGSGIKALCY